MPIITKNEAKEGSTTLDNNVEEERDKLFRCCRGTGNYTTRICFFITKSQKWDTTALGTLS
jgi:hypothetical protein